MLPSDQIPIKSTDPRKATFYKRLRDKTKLVKLAFRDMLALLTLGYVDQASGVKVDISHTLREITILCTLLGCVDQFKHLDLWKKDIVVAHLPCLIVFDCL